MKARAIRTSLETFGVATATEFTIKATAKAFRALIDGIYSDKVGTPVRELCSNAWDSHVAAGESRRFVVHAPTKVHPEFYVRDYGVGMSHEKIETIYSTLFASDKDDSNLMVGQKGLGSKSPFAFTDVFYIHAYDDGVVRHYQAAIGQNGIPQILYCGHEATEEPRGIKVGFAVEAEHHDAFAAAIRYTALGMQPTFKSNIKVVGLDDLICNYKGDGYWAADHKTFPIPNGYKDNFWVRQGCVLYPLDEEKVQHAPGERWGDCWIIDMPIGTVDVTESREAIQYTPETKTAISNRLAALRGQIRDDIYARAKDLTNVTEFFSAMNKRPTWVDVHNVAHPATGLFSTTIPLLGGRCSFHAEIDEDYRSYEARPNVHAHNSRHTYYVVRDVSQVINHDLQETADELKIMPIVQRGRELEIGERRKLIALMKGYMGRENLGTATFLFGADWTPDFWEKAFPNVTVVETTIEEMNLCLPFAKRFKLAKPKTIYGLSLVTYAKTEHGYDSGERKEIKQLPAELDNAAYVLTGTYRDMGEYTLLRMARELGVRSLMVAYSKAPQYLTEAGVKPLEEFLVDQGALVGLNRQQFVRFVLSYDKALKPYMHLLWRLDEHVPEQFERVRKSNGPLGLLCREMAPAFELRRKGFDLSKLNDTDRKRLMALIAPHGRPGEPLLPVTGWLCDRFGVFSDLVQAIASGFGNSKCTSRASERVDALFAIQSSFRDVFKRNSLCRYKSTLRPSRTRKSPSSSTAPSARSPARPSKALA